MDKQAKDFEKGWEEHKKKKNQQIEEMAKWLDELWIDYPPTSTEVAEAIYNASYRKISEGTVVLTREEYSKLLQKIADLQYDKDMYKQLEERVCDLQYDKFEIQNEISEKDNKIALLEETIECIKFNIDFTRKETAEKFAEMAKAVLIKAYDHYVENADKNEKAGIRDMWCYWNGETNATQKSIDLIDEICKEFTEGNK